MADGRLDLGPGVALGQPFLLELMLLQPGLALPGLSLPIRVVHGTADRSVSHDDTRSLARLIPPSTSSRWTGPTTPSPNRSTRRQPTVSRRTGSHDSWASCRAEPGMGTVNTAYLSALSTLAGLAIGALAFFMTTWLTQHYQRIAQEGSRREKLYGGFIDQASILFGDALINQLTDSSKIVPLYAVMGKLRLFGPGL